MTYFLFVLDDLRQTRVEKLNNLVKAGLEVYPEKSQKDFSNSHALENFENLLDKDVSLTGRVRSLRQMGALVFFHIEDETAKIQCLLKKDSLGEELFDLFANNIDIGDFVQAEGKLFTTKTGEKTVEVKSWKILSKSINPIPTEFYGLKDKEELLRKRYLDLIVNPETREIFKKKNIFWKTVREILGENGFLEVDTPVLEAVPGGADARPFITHHNALDRDFYLRISLELPLKRLLVGGFEKVYEIGKVFRNEGIDAEHLQDYIAMEFYWAYSDMKKGMDLVEKMYKEIVRKITGGLETEYDGNKINWDNKWPASNASQSDAGWPVLDYFEEFKKATGIDLSDDSVTAEALKEKAKELGIKYEMSYGKGRMIDTIYKKTIRTNLIQPCFLTGHPIEVSPLAKRDPKNKNKVLRFQPIAGGSELGNGFSELNDSLDQRGRFEEQMRLRKMGDDEAQMIDEDFVEALEYGMPPAVGFGLSERFFSFVMNRPIRETVIFPPMKEKAE